MVRAFPVKLRHEGEVFELDVLCADSILDDRVRILLATSLPTATLEETATVGSLAGGLFATHSST
ncbi:MAG: hypothetical protein KGM24_01770 [Elusimicrobia bacterium]|nr:hypothetical protein [Elusimicrobiota bacterium]